MALAVMETNAIDIDIDVSVIPFSQRGSFFSLSTKAGSQGCLTPGCDVYLITHCRQFGFPLFALRAIPPGHPLQPPSGFHTTDPPTTLKATSTLLAWQYGGSTVAEVTFLHDRCLRFRGTVPLAFDTEATLEKEACSAYMFSRPRIQEQPTTIDYVFSNMPGFRFIAIKGRMTQTNGNQPEVLNKRIEISRSEGDNYWELLVCELEVQNTSGPTVDTCAEFTQTVKNTSFDSMAKENHAIFDEFARSLCPWSSPSLTSPDRLASYVIWAATVRASGRLTRESILMSKLWMNRVWSWDNCLNALGVASGDLKLALGQIQLFIDLQAPDGRLPDSIDWASIEWGHTKPPIQGWAISKLLAERGSGINDAVLLELYESTTLFTDFWMQHRCGDVSRLPWYPHGNDAGWDNSTVFDHQSVIVGPDCAAFLIIQASALAELAERLGQPPRERERWLLLKDRLTTALIEELWDGDVFLVKNALTGETKKSTSLFTLMPLTAAKFLPEKIVAKMVSDLSKHMTAWGLATEQLDSPFYESDGYWRGPIWAPSTQLIESGLRDAGYHDLANQISERFISLCTKSGFAENYDAITGEGLRDLSHTWSAATYLSLRREAAARSKLAVSDN